MTWLVFGVSCLLVLAGAVSIISGAPMIQLERGWAEVISGTVALASGGVVFALAGILMRLESIRDTLVARTLPVTADAVPAPPRSEALPPVPPAEPIGVAPPPGLEPMAEPSSPPATELPTAEAREQALWKRVKRPEGERPSAETLRQHGFPDRVLPEEAPAQTPLDEAPVLVPAHTVPAPMAPAEPAGAEAVASVREPGQASWLERSLFKGRPGRGDEAAIAARPAPPRSGERLEPAMPALLPTPAERIAVAAPEQTLAAEPQPTPDLASEQHGGATVVGRYQAGSASYVMYSDGTIEVETESGETHRFGSMDELKAFIAKQEATAS